MAIVKENVLIQGLSGKVGKQLVFKTRNHKTFVSKIPDMSRVIASEKQLAEKSKFAKAVAYAKAVLANPIKKVAVEKLTPKGKLVYHQAIKEYYDLSKNQNRSSK